MWNSTDAEDGMTALGVLARAGMWVGVFLAPVRASMLAVSFLVLCDLLTGLAASRKEGKAITSWGLRASVHKTFWYQMSLVVAFVAESLLLQGVPVVRAVAGLIAVAELKSNLENLHRLTGLDLWTEVLSFLRPPKTPPK